MKKTGLTILLFIVMLQVSGYSGPLPPDAEPPLGPESLMTIAGPDEYGYWLSDEVTVDNAGYAFIDISTTGSLLDLTSDRDQGIAPGMIRPFDFYSLEDVTTGYISVNGFISFSPIANLDKSNVAKPFPTDSIPNTMIAPFWADLYLSPESAIYTYTNGSCAPEAVGCSIIQWDNIKIKAREDYFTVQVILYDSGNILFAYQSDTENPLGVTAGIEDGDGVAGLNYQIPSLAFGENVLISRPAAGYHLKARPQISSAFFSNGETWLSVDVSNTTNSSAPVDTYNLTVDILDSDPVDYLYPWGVEFFDPTCMAPITQISNLPAGATTQLCMRVTAGGEQMPGYFARIQITIESIGDPTRKSSVYLQTTIGSPYGQIWQDDPSGLQLDMLQVSGRSSLDISIPFNGAHMAMNQIRPGYYILTWLEGSDINYRIYRQYPGILGSIHQIPASPDDPRDPYYDLSPAVASSRNGIIGMLFLVNQYQLDAEDHVLLNSNIWYTTMDIYGNILGGPVNLTNNPSWLDIAYGYTGDAIPRYYDLRILPVGDDQLGLIWRTNYFPFASSSMDRIEGYIAETDWSEFYWFELPDWSASNRHVYPAVAELEDGRFMVSYIDYTGSSDPWVIKYRVIEFLDAQPYPDNISISSANSIAGSNGSMVDLTQLSSGKVMLAWQDNLTRAIQYAIINSNLSVLDVGPVSLSYEDYPGHQNYRSSSYPSVARTIDDNGVITWQDDDWREQIYYTLIASDGTQVTPPTLYRRVTSILTENKISVNTYGNSPAASEFLTMPVIYNRYLPSIRYCFPQIRNQ